jgi:hypothetical protein
VEHALPGLAIGLKNPVLFKKNGRRDWRPTVTIGSFAISREQRLPPLSCRSENHVRPCAGDMGVFARMKEGPTTSAGIVRRTKGGLNTTLHAVTNAKRRSLRFFMTAGQVSDYTVAAALLGSVPAAEWLIADRGHDVDWFREALKDKGIRPSIFGRRSPG